MGLTTTQVTLLGTIGMIANTLAQTLLWGRILDRAHRPTLFISVGEMIAGIGHFFVFFWHKSLLKSGSLLQAGFSIILGLATIEIFWSMSNVGWSAIISDLTLKTERSQLMALLSFIGGIGGLFGATVGGFLFMDGLGFSEGTLFYFPAVVMILSGFIVVMTIKESSVKEVIAKVNSNGDENGEQTHNEYLKFKEIPNHNLILLFLVVLVLVNFGRNSVILITQLYLASDIGFNVGGNGLGLFRNISSIAVMFWSIVLNSKHLKGKEKEMFIFGILCVIMGYIWLIFSPSFGLSLISAFLIGTSQIVIQVTSYTLISTLIPPSWRGRIFSWYNATFMLSFGIAGTLITGPISDYLIYGRGYSDLFAYRIAFIAAIIIVTFGLILFFPLRKAFQLQLANDDMSREIS